MCFGGSAHKCRSKWHKRVLSVVTPQPDPALSALSETAKFGELRVCCGARQNESGSAQQNEAIRVTELGATFVTLSLRISGAGTVAGALGVPAELGSW